MKIDKILFISDDNPNYLQFWPSISRFYKKYFDIQPKLFFLGEKNESNKEFLVENYGEIEYVKILPEIPVIIQALWGKFWFTQQEPETNWLIGDIDLYILNKQYILDSIKDVSDNSYVHLNANGYHLGNWWDNNRAGLPGYLHLAKGSVFKEYLSLSPSFEEDCKYIYESKKYGILYNGLISNDRQAPERVKDKDSYGFICCEENLSTERLLPYKNEIISSTYPANLKRIETPFAKSGRNTPESFDLKSLFNSANKNLYIDLHSPRPYSSFSSGIESILSHYV